MKKSGAIKKDWRSFSPSLIQSSLRYLKPNATRFRTFLLPISNLGEHFYLGIEFSVEEDELFVAYMRDFARTHGYQTIAFPFIRYIEKKDAIVLEIAKAIRDDSELAIQELEGSEYLLTKKK
jgi:DNA polymerase III alpha subunit